MCNNYFLLNIYWKKSLITLKNSTLTRILTWVINGSFLLPVGPRSDPFLKTEPDEKPVFTKNLARPFWTGPEFYLYWRHWNISVEFLLKLSRKSALNWLPFFIRLNNQRRPTTTTLLKHRTKIIKTFICQSKSLFDGNARNDRSQQ